MTIPRTTRLPCIYLGMALVLSCCVSSCSPGGRGGGDAPLWGVHTYIEDGDDAFTEHEYDVALWEYTVARRELEQLAAFEERAARKDEDFMQRCQNLRSLVEMRIELASIALEVKEINKARAALKRRD